MCTQFIKTKNPHQQNPAYYRVDYLQRDTALQGQAKELLAQLEMAIFVFPQKNKKMQPHKAATEMATGKYALHATRWLAFFFEKEKNV